MPAAPPTADTTSTRGLLVGLALGTPFLVAGIRGVLVDDRLTRPAELTRWIVGGALVHDLLLVPVVLAVATGLRRVVPAVAWPPVRWALALTGVLVLVGWPFVRGYGQAPSVPSLLARDYGEGLAVAVAVVWLVAAAWLAVRAHRPAPAERRVAIDEQG